MLPRGVGIIRVMHLRLYSRAQFGSAMRSKIYTVTKENKYFTVHPNRTYCKNPKVNGPPESATVKTAKDTINAERTQNTVTVKNTQNTANDQKSINTELLKSINTDTKLTSTISTPAPTQLPKDICTGGVGTAETAAVKSAKDFVTVNSTQNTATEQKSINTELLKTINTDTKLTSASSTPTPMQLPKTASADTCKPPTLVKVATTIKDTTPQHSDPTVPSQTHTKTLEVKTSKGVLSVTTTIEDSKINDVIFQKAKPPESSSQQQQKTIKLTEDNTVNEHLKAAIGPVPVTAAVASASMKKQETVVNQQILDSAASLALEAKAKAAAIVAAEMAAKAQKENETIKKKGLKVDVNRSSMERNFVTPTRAMVDFLLKASDLEQLPKIKRRSPYEQEPAIIVFWRKDVEAKAMEVWGSRENMLAEKLKRELERKKHQQNIFTVKRRLRDYRREIGARTVVMDDEPGLRGKSGKVVLTAISINAVNFVFKVGGWLYTGSHSMFAEAIHSLADTINQMILAYGIHKSVQSADPDHPYGYSNMKYVSSLISGVGIFCVGAGVSFYHGITGLINPEPMQDFFWAFFILGGSLASESATLVVALGELRRSAKRQQISLKNYVLSGRDPSVNVVVTEDAAAVMSVAVAATCMGLSSLTGSSTFDAVGSLLIGSILGVVASFIIYTNVAALVGKSIPQENLDKINTELESDFMVRAIHDVKGIDMGNSLVRYKAELDFDGRELTRSYLEKQDLNELLKIVKSVKTVEELEEFLLKHGENIVDLLGGEIDRIEMRLRKNFPEIRHCDLEVL